MNVLQGAIGNPKAKGTRFVEAEHIGVPRQFFLELEPQT